jgi:hypothetical protein
LAAAQRQLLQLYRERVGPSLDKLLRWKGAMRAVETLGPGDVTLDKFWHEYDVSVNVVIAAFALGCDCSLSALV